MNHSFNVEIATEYGIFEAVLMEHLYFWITKNKANDVHYHDGYYWTYNSIKALSELFPYVSKNTISRALHRLGDEGLVIVGNYNKSPYDRTAWYALTEKSMLLLGAGSEMDSSRTGNSISQNNEMDNSKNKTDSAIMDNSISQNGEMENGKMQNENNQTGTTIPYINTDIDTDNNLTVSKDTVCRTGVQQVTEQWNLLASCGIKPVSSITPGTKRYEMLNARIRSYGIDKVLEAVKSIKNSAFLCGDNKNGWTITFDWFVRPNNFIKVLEGNYCDARTDAMPPCTGQLTGKSGYPVALLEKLAGGGAGYGQA